MSLASIICAEPSGVMMPTWLDYETTMVARIRETILSAQRIDLTDAAKFVYEVSDKEDWPASSLPSVAPPFQTFWLEWKQPSIINNATTGKIIRDPAMIAFSPRTGVIVHAIDLFDIAEESRGSAVESFIGSASESRVGLKFATAARSTRCRWVVSLELICQYYQAAFMPTGFTEFWAVAEDGAAFADYCHLLANRDPGFDFSALSGDLVAARFGISLMQCKNVSLVEESTPRRGYTRRAQGQPRLKIYNLEIDPMRDTLRRDGKAETTGLSNALHLCRGHFKDYRISGLFGKLKGVFWWGQTVKGSSAVGTVDKRYSVKAPPIPAGLT